MTTSLKFTLILATTCLLAACSGYSFNTNLDKENFSDYFAVSQVSYYQADQLSDYYVEQMGVIETEDCQTSLMDPPAEKKKAMIAAKRIAAKKGANGIIIDSCIVPPSSKLCLSSYICYSSAIKVTPLKKQESNE